ncbi:MAG: phosphatidylserine decarboxylase family protein [Saccharothrix sp.]|nr:phosphatidylserine decarboxylase family protein [Saccharothrix sp.]
MSADVAKQVGDWLPANQVYLAGWLDELIGQAKGEAERRESAARPLELDVSLRKFSKFVHGNPEVYVLFMDMFEQLSLKVTPTGYPQVKSFAHMLELIDIVIRTVPKYDKTGLVGFPINVILNWAMGTSAGFAAFLNKDVNRELKPVLDKWAAFLRSSRSKEPMRVGRWLDEDALRAMSDLNDEGTVQTHFLDLFDCKKDEPPYYGFTSWNHFFTRSFRNPREHRPVAPGDNVVVSACEASPYRVRRNVRLYDNFSVKGQPYSLAHLLDTAHKEEEEPAEDYFDGGTVYQGFLAALNYHQWHSPVDGMVVACRRIPGSYYSETPAALCDPAAPDISQGYIAHVATRALIFIETTSPEVGIVCFVAIGMAEVSSCVLDDNIEPGAWVRRGDRLGEFQYGGSSHCLVFKPGVKLTFVEAAEKAEEKRDNPTKIRVNAKLATVEP